MTFWRALRLPRSAGGRRGAGGGITNHNFRVSLGGEDYMLRVHGSNTELLGIDRRAERVASETAASLGNSHGDRGQRAGRAADALHRLLARRARRAWRAREELARALRSFHDSGVSLPAVFWCPTCWRVRAHRRASASAACRGVRRDGGRGGAHRRRARARRAHPCHNDLLPGNIIRRAAGRAADDRGLGVRGMGHPCFDLGNLSVNNGFDASTDDRLLAAYHGEPPSDARRATLKLMRVLSDAREAAWAWCRRAISSLEFDFDGYGEEHFERLLGAAQQPDFEEWLAAA